MQRLHATGRADRLTRSRRRARNWAISKARRSDDRDPSARSQCRHCDRARRRARITEAIARTAATGLASLGDPEPPVEAAPTRRSAAMRAREGAIKAIASGWRLWLDEVRGPQRASLLLSEGSRVPVRYVPPPHGSFAPRSVLRLAAGWRARSRQGDRLGGERGRVRSERVCSGGRLKRGSDRLGEPAELTRPPWLVRPGLGCDSGRSDQS
jgi:hypothetical protein